MDLLVAEVVGTPLVVGVHGVFAFLPIHGVDFAVLLEVLEGIDHPQAFADGAAEGHVVDNLVTNDAFLVDEEEAAVGDELAFDDVVSVFVDRFVSSQNIIGFRDGLVDVGNERIGYTLDFLPGLLEC